MFRNKRVASPFTPSSTEPVKINGGIKKPPSSFPEDGFIYSMVVMNNIRPMRYANRTYRATVLPLSSSSVRWL